MGIKHSWPFLVGLVVIVLWSIVCGVGHAFGVF